MKDVILVSEEMTTLVGRGPVPHSAPLPPDSVMFVAGIDADLTPTLTFCDQVDLSDANESPLVLIVQRAACARLFSAQPEGPHTWHFPSALLTLALSIIDCEAVGEAQATLRLARSIELLCQIHAAFADGLLVPAGPDGALSELDIARIAAARRVVDQRWQEKLTIAELARIAGVNRDKLVRGFRELYGATIAEVLSERRLREARRMLLASDLPVATVAYRCSYLNNAAFTRAFNRRYGLAPTELRRMGVAA